MRFNLLVVLISTFFISSYAYSTEIISLNYKGKIIQPSCVTSLTAGDGAKAGKIDLDHCPGTAGKVEVNEDGTVECMSKDEGLMSIPYDSYKVIGMYSGLYLLKYGWSGGGTGDFTGLIGVRIKKNWLYRVYTLNDGDRCNGGLLELWKVMDQVRTRISLTPFELIDLAEGRPTLSKDNKIGDLEDTHNSCVATAVFQIDPVSGKETLVEVDLGNDPIENIKNWTKSFKNQIYFNAVYNSFISAKKNRLDPKGIEEFLTAFRKKCFGQ